MIISTWFKIFNVFLIHWWTLKHCLTCLAHRYGTDCGCGNGSLLKTNDGQVNGVRLVDFSAARNLRIIRSLIPYKRIYHDLEQRDSRCVKDIRIFKTAVIGSDTKG
jgi:hypothetical protein